VLLSAYENVLVVIRGLFRFMRDILSVLMTPFKLLVRNLLTYSLAPTVAGIRKTTLLEQVWLHTVNSGAEYVNTKMHSAVLFNSPRELWKHALSKNLTAGLCCEFGVFRGTSINFFAQVLEEKFGERQGTLIHGFDSFEGLQEDWSGSTGMLKGHFSLNGKLPKVSPRVELHKGYFNIALPDFLESHSENIAFLHLDADTYQSTKFVLESVISRISTGTIIIFDEYVGYPAWQKGEFLAWQETVRDYAISYTYLGVSTAAVSVRIDSLG